MFDLAMPDVRIDCWSNIACRIVKATHKDTGVSVTVEGDCGQQIGLEQEAIRKLKDKLELLGYDN